jgi:hypothetical protein
MLRSAAINSLLDYMARLWLGAPLAERRREQASRRTE